MPDVEGVKPAVLYLARGADFDHFDKFKRFLNSYLKYRSGVAHDLYIIYKGFKSTEEQKSALNFFSQIPHMPIYINDKNFDLGAYRTACDVVQNSTVCLLNTNSEIMAQNWLVKFVANLEPRVGAVGATGSLQSLRQLDVQFPEFPNIHLRTNAIMLRTDHVRQFIPARIESKHSAYLVESGVQSLTRRLINLGLSVKVVGKNGRGYHSNEWCRSGTFRQNVQENLLVHDNATRHYENSPFSEKCILVRYSWGACISQSW